MTWMCNTKFYELAYQRLNRRSINEKVGIFFSRGRRVHDDYLN